MPLLDLLNMMALAAALTVLVSGFWRPLPLLSFGLGLLGHLMDLPWAQLLCLTGVSLGLILPGFLMAYAKRAAQRGAFERAIFWISPLALLRRDPLSRGLRRVWQTGLAHFAGDNQAIPQLVETLLEQPTPRTQAFIALLSSLSRQWQALRFSSDPDLRARALCELGSLEEAITLSVRLWRPRITPGQLGRARRALLAPLSFAGSLKSSQQLIQLLRLPPPLKDLWSATALSAAGQREEAEGLLALRLSDPGLSPALRVSLEDRLQNLPSPQLLSPQASQALIEAEREVEAGDLLRLRGLEWSSLLLSFPLLLGFLIQQLRGGALSDRVASEMGALLITPEGPSDWSQIFSYGLLHFGWLHLGANLLGLLALSPLLRRSLGLKALLFLFWGSILGAGLGIALFSHPALVLGASGGVMGMLGAALMVTLLHPVCRNSVTGRLGSRLILGLLFLQTAFDLITPQVSFVGHFVGALSGILLSGLYLKFEAWE